MSQHEMERMHTHVTGVTVARPSSIEKRRSEEKAFIINYGDRASYSRVYKRIWIGDMGAAIGVATGSIMKFSAVVNASGSEIVDGVSLSNIAARHRSGAKHETTWDRRGIGLSDQQFIQVSDVISNRERSKEQRSPGRWFLMEPYLYWSYKANHSTRAAFEALVMKTAENIHKLLEETSGNILVHCYAGRNRSAACIVAYLLKYVESSFVDAIGLLEQAMHLRGLGIVLDNQDFRDALEHLPVSLEVANENLNKEIETVYQAFHNASTDSCFISSDIMDEVSILNQTTTCYGPRCTNNALYSCGACGEAMYCSKKCQVLHWKSGHKLGCFNART